VDPECCRERSESKNWLNGVFAAAFEDTAGFQLVDIAHDKSVLSVVDPRLPFRLNGTADVLLVKRRAKNPLNKLVGIRLVIELKGKVESSHLPQALGQLASCSLKAPLHCVPRAC
jgi:hypothetical protein